MVRERTGVYYSTEPLLGNERMQLGTMGATRAPEHAQQQLSRRTGLPQDPLPAQTSKAVQTLV